MQEPSFILAISLIVIAIVGILAFRLFISRRQQKKGKMNYQKDAMLVFEWPSYQNSSAVRLLTAPDPCR